jgi:hypothetical protein
VDEAGAQSNIRFHLLGIRPDDVRLEELLSTSGSFVEVPSLPTIRSSCLTSRRIGTKEGPCHYLKVGAENSTVH